MSDMQFFGTSEGNYRIWCNSSDFSGLLLSSIVWSLFIYIFTALVCFIVSGYIYSLLGSIILVFLCLGGLCHLKTMLTDPGTVPSHAKPACVLSQGSPGSKQLIPVCGICEAYKPHQAHHDRISSRCISRMDHFCPWMNNAIGAKNQKHFILFLVYSDIAAGLMYVALALQLVALFPGSLGSSEVTGADLTLARVTVSLLPFILTFLSSMVANQAYGLFVGMGTIDRMKVRSGFLPLRAATPLSHVFGGELHWAWLPVDPIFPRPEEVLHYRLVDDDYRSLA